MATARRVSHAARVKAVIADGEAQGLFLAAEHLLAESIKVVPIEEATLQDSGVATVDKQRRKAAVSFDTPYAVRQHEELDYEHDAGRSSKYLEGPMHSEADTIRDIIAAQIRVRASK